MTVNLQASLDQLAASDPAATVWVNANAGSGKTHVLVDRVIRLMLGGTEPSRIMCLTFTKAAAAEMANRLFERLSKWIALSDEELSARLASLGSANADAMLLERARQLFTRALETPGGLKIQTIHAFCERVLQLFPVEAGIVPHFTMLDDRQSLNLLQTARNSVLAMAKTEGATEIGAALLDIANRVSPDGFDSLLTQLLAKRANLRGVLQEESGLVRAEALLRIHMSLVQGETKDSLTAGLTCDVERYLDVASALETGSKTEKDRGAEIRAICAAGNVSLLALQSILLTKQGEPRKAVANKSTLDRHGWLGDFIGEEQSRLADAMGRMGDLECLSATLSVLRLGSAIVETFEQMKRRQGSYDFDDLIIKTGELLSEKPDAAWVLYKLDGGIEHLLVDEAQDTSPMQWQIVRSLTEEFFSGEGRHGRKPRTLFVVGDRKQSIYSFQGADPNVFERVLVDVKAQVKAAGQEFRPVDFTVSFRSAPEILQAVDDVFAPDSQARLGLDGETARDWHHESNRRSAKGTVEIWPLIAPEDTDDRDPWQAPVDREPAHSPRRRLAKKLAQTIKGWIGRRQLISLGRAVTPGDILILVRRRNSFFDAMIRALWNEQVPVAGADRLKLSENIAVLDLMALAQFAVMPEDDHALACILKSPVFPRPLTEDELIAIAAKRNALSLWESLQKQDGPPFAAAAEILRPLIAEAPSARPFEFLSGVLAKSRLRFVSRLGSEANDAIDALLDRALDYEEASGTSLAGFANWFAAGEIEIKRNMEQGADEVRVMTVHGAKGLEAPIVILPDTAAAPTQSRSSPLLMLDGGDVHARVPLWPVPKLGASKAVKALKALQKDVEAAEYQRLLYVAMTRARDELYVCGYEGKNKPSDNCWYETIKAALTPKMESLGEDIGWRLGVPPVVASEAAASQVVAKQSVPDWIARDVEPSPALAVPLMPVRPARFGQVARGILIHRILQQLPELGDAERATHIAAVVKHAGFAPALSDELIALIGNPMFVELLSGEGSSEVPLITQGAAGRPERRRIDRLVRTASGILIADYKTDRSVPATPEACNPEYLSQMATYRNALRLIHPGEALRVCLVWTETPLLMAIPDELLDRMSGLQQPRP
ncbi:double-strand break repair helicase AddA [Aestuariivirga sp.]|uniref:double-strand break repair helicase AddA n=1 Tax=Aestuariivirga sp. TaxID=2650926 RepID=UPI0035933D33